MKSLNDSQRRLKALSRLPAMRDRLHELERDLHMFESRCNLMKAAEVRCEMAALEAEIHMIEEDF